MKRNIFDERELLMERSVRAGIGSRESFFISIDAGMNLVDTQYLIGLGLRGRQLRTAERIVQEFYWGDLGSDQ
jgi:hypothetical protein